MQDEINNLPDDCLIEVFRRLPIYQRVEIEEVCRRWKEIAKSSWHDLKHLLFLRFSHGEMDSRTIFEIQKTPHLIKRIVNRCGNFLKELKIASPCSPEILSTAVDTCPNLSKLTIDAGNITCRTSHCPEKYDLSKAELNLGRLTKLRHLSLKYFQSTDDVLKSLSMNHRSLSHLCLYRCQIDRPTLDLITRLDSLEVLQLTHSQIDDNWLEKLIDESRRIKHLDISYSEFITDLGAAQLHKLANLEGLSVQGTPNITDKSLMRLCNLRELNCSFCEGVSDPGVISLLRNAPNLMLLNLDGTKISTKTVAEAYIKWQAMGENRRKFIISVDLSVQGSWPNTQEPFPPFRRQESRLKNIFAFE